MEIMRLMVAGPSGAGKSTFIRSVSEIESVDHESLGTDETGLVKHAAVTPNFGQLAIGPDRVLHLYKAPLHAPFGRLSFNYTWDLLIQKSHAYILLVSANMPGGFRHARLIYRFMQEQSSLPMIVGLTHVDCFGAWDADNIAIALGFTDPTECPPMIGVNATNQVSVTNALMVLMEQCLKIV